MGFFLPTVVPALRRDGDRKIEIEPGGGIEINAWLTIDSGGSVTVRCPFCEVGQGAMTSVALMIAEELDVPWDKVRVVFADANRHVTGGKEYTSMSSGASFLVRGSYPFIMQAGASARERLRIAAAEAWGLSGDAVQARQGLLTAQGKSASYGQFAAAAATIRLPQEPKIKSTADWWLLGKGVTRLDIAEKVDGRAIYPMDVRLPGMVYAAAHACPVRGGRLKKFDFEAVRTMPGVIAVVELKQTRDKLKNQDLSSGVAIVADSFWRARTALEAMPVEWDLGEGESVDDAGMEARARTILDGRLESSKDVRGDAVAIIARSDKVIRAEYRRPHECAAPMSPPAAVADVKPGRIDLWTFTQDMSTALKIAAKQAGVKKSDVFVHGTYQGGSFGHGNGTDIVRQAVEISKQIGRPVKLIRTREEDMARPEARAAVWGRFEAALNEDGLPSALLIRAAGATERVHHIERGLADIVYRIPNIRIERGTVPSNILTGANRAPGSNNNTFMIEQFVDEMALAGGWDPLEWRIRMTEGNERWQRALLKLKDIAGYSMKLSDGTGMGIAAVELHETAVAACATVQVSREGAVRVVKMSVVVNAGHVINPTAAVEQIRGCIAWELGYALHGGLEIERGRIRNTNFDSYAPLRLPEMPEVECVFANSEQEWWGGIGEVAVPITAPAVANAIYFATGKRIRATPIDKHDLSWS